MRGEQQFRDFASGFAPALHRLAYLLTGDTDAAGSLTVQALRRTRRRWRDVTEGELPEVIAVKELVRGSTRAASSGADLERGPSEDPRAVERDRMWAWLRELPPRQRAGLALDHLPADLPFDVDRATFGLPAYDGEVPQGLLGETLAERAQLLPPLNLDIESVSRDERRRTLRAAGVATLVVALAAGSWASVTLSKRSAPEASPTPEATFDLTGKPAIQPPLPWPTRGNLADDADALAELRVGFANQNRFIVGGIQVLFASDLPQGRFALVAGKHENGSNQFMWYIDSAGQKGEPLWWTAEPPFISGGEYTAMHVSVRLPAGPTLMVVIGPEDLEPVEVSWRPSYSPDGTVQRTYEALPVVDGLVLQDLGSRPAHLVRIRIGGDVSGQRLQPSGPGWSWEVPTWPSDDARLKAESGEADPDRVRGALGQLAAELGVTDLGEITPRVVWGGSFNDEPAALIHASRRGGGDFKVLAISSTTWMWVVPRAAPDFPAAWPIEMGPDSQKIGVLAWPEAVQAEFLAGDPLLSGRVEPFSIRTFDVPMDWNVTEPAPSIVLRDASGKLLWTRPLMELPGPRIEGDG